MVVFTTPGLIDIRSFTMMGVSAKPNSDRPIGQFGTGLKYAIAVLVRHDISPIVYIGRDKYTFIKKEGEFRGRKLDMIQMKLEKWNWRKPRFTDLPYTTDYGKNWGLWQVFRELEANTRDEGGQTVLNTHFLKPEEFKQFTQIIIDSSIFDDVYNNRDTIFLPGAKVECAADDIMEVFEGESEYLFYRGMRVQELGKPSKYTYNILKPIQLTEDRTVQYDFQVKEYLGNFVAKHNDAAFIKNIVTCGDKWWEHEVDFTSWSRPKPSPTYMSVVASRPSGLIRSAEVFYDEHDPVAIEVIKTKSPEEAHPAPWKTQGDYIMDANNRPVAMKPTTYRGDWEVIAKWLIDLAHTAQEYYTPEEMVDDGPIPF